MESISIRSPAKINLFLRVTGIRDDGYHEIATLFQMVTLYDRLTLSKSDNGIRIVSSNNKIPEGCANLAFKAAELLKTYSDYRSGALIRIEKNIPVAAGLGGGSSNAAFTLDGLNRLWDLRLTSDELRDIAVKIGADVPFFLSCPTALGFGIGDKLIPISPITGLYIVLINPHIHILAKWAYENLQLTSFANISKIKDRFILKGHLVDSNFIFRSIADFGKEFKNDLELPVLAEYKEIDALKELLKRYGALYSLMSGSGSTVFGVFEDYKTAEYAYNKLLSVNGSVFLVHTVSDREALFIS